MVAKAGLRHYFKVEAYEAPLSFNNDNSSHQMDNTIEHALPLYDHKEAPNNEGLPSYEAGLSVGRRSPALVIDPTGMFINESIQRYRSPNFLVAMTASLNVADKDASDIVDW